MEFPWKNQSIKCVVLCGGKGTRLLPATAYKQKAMIKVAGKPIINHIIDYWSRYTKEFVFVLHYKKEEIMEHVKKLPIKADFIELNELRGIAHGLRNAKEILSENFIVVLGDCLLRGYFEFPKFVENGVGVWNTNDKENIKKSFSVETSGDYIKKVIEKPAETVNDLCGMGCYFFNKKIFEYIDKTNPSNLRGEIELTDAIQNSIDGKEKISILKFIGDYININHLNDLRRAEEIFSDS